MPLDCGNGESNAGDAPCRRGLHRNALAGSYFIHFDIDFVLTAVRFRARRMLALLRRASHALESRGWRVAWSALARRERVTWSTAENVVPAFATGTNARHVLIVDVTTPRPDRDSGSLRLFNLMRLLLRKQYRVSFIADDGRHAGDCTQALQRLGVDVVEAPPMGWMSAHGPQLDAVILCRHHVAGHWLPLVRSLAPHARIVFDTVDLHFLREQREAKLRGSARLQRRALATQAIELRLVARADATWVVSDAEQLLLREHVPQAQVDVLSNIIDSVVPGREFDARHGMLFVGGHRHPPNSDAVWWLLREIFPRLRERMPQMDLHLIGADTTSQMKQAACAQPGVFLHGHVSNIEPYLSGCRIAIAPLRFGAGVKGKVNLSMAHGLPVVATSCAIEGMHLRPEYDVLVADDVDGLVAAVVRLHEDPDLWRRLSASGMENVRRYFSFDAAAVVIGRTLEEVAAESSGSHRDHPDTCAPGA